MIIHLLVFISGIIHWSILVVKDNKVKSLFRFLIVAYTYTGCGKILLDLLVKGWSDNGFELFIIIKFLGGTLNNFDSFEKCSAICCKQYTRYAYKDDAKNSSNFAILNITKH